MNIKSVIRINSALLAILAISMLIPASVAYGFGEAVSAFLISSTLCAAIGLAGWVFSRKNKKITNKDGFAIVTIAWVVTAFAGSLPFYIGGYIPNFTDAFLLRNGLEAIGLGSWMGTIMLFNVWVLIWPNQQKILGMKKASDDEKVKARRVALLASRTNTMLSIPMLLLMTNGLSHRALLGL